MGGKTGPESEPQVPADDQSFAARLNKLFATQKDANGKPFSTEAIAERCSAFGEQISVAYLYHLRRGDRSNPSPAKLSAIAKAFGVGVGYFFQWDDPAAEEDHAVRVAMSNPRVRSIAMRAAELTPEFAAVLEQMIQNLETLPSAVNKPQKADETPSA